MLKSYIIIAVRNILREKFYSLLNVTGLAIGIACFILISLWIKDELSYDRHFRNHDRIYRIESSLVTEGVPKPMAATDRRLYSRLRAHYGHVCDAVTVFRLPTLLTSQGGSSYEDQAIYADETFFRIFSFGFIHGNPHTALSQKGSVVITETLARKLFGDRNPVGEALSINNPQTKDKPETFVVTGVVKDNPRNSHFHPGAVFRRAEVMDTFEIVYILLKEGYSAEWFAAQVWQPLYEKYFRPNYIGEKQDITLDRVQPLTGIHLGGTKWEDFEPNSSRSLLYVLGAIGCLILLLACINYINLATARSFSRSREIGVRKVLGATRRQIISQFLIEAVITSLLALLAAFSLVEIFMPPFNDLADKQLSLPLSDPALLAAFVLFSIVLGILSGFYPAFYISAIQPAKVLTVVPDNSRSRPTFRKLLIVLQFSISITMLIATLVITRQLAFLKGQDLGFDTDRMLIVSLDDEKVYRQQAALRTALLKNRNILKASMSHNIPGNEVNHTYISFESPDGMHGHLINSMFVDPYYPGAMNLEFVEGRGFDSSMVSRLDTSAFIIINESARKLLGYDKAVGKKVNTGSHYGLRLGEVVGVVKDFHTSSLHRPIEPLALALGTLGRPEGKKKFLTVKLRSEDLQNTIAFIERTYRSFGQGFPFRYNFLDQAFNDQYRKEEKQRVLFNWFAGLSIFGSFLGLIGLASFFAKQRRKEMSIRRISGARSYQIIWTLAADFIRLTILAWLLAASLGFWVMDRWLSVFAYHIRVRPGELVLPGIAALVLVLLTITVHTLLVIRKKPASSLRHE